jgi:hypothetical protein
MRTLRSEGHKLMAATASAQLETPLEDLKRVKEEPDLVFL